MLNDNVVKIILCKEKPFKKEPLFKVEFDIQWTSKSEPDNLECSLCSNSRQAGKYHCSLKHYVESV